MSKDSRRCAYNRYEKGVASKEGIMNIGRVNGKVKAGAMLCLVLFVMYFSRSIIAENAAEIHHETTPVPTREEIVAMPSYLVYITGSVKEPGLYAAGDSLTAAEAIADAGGLLPYADTAEIPMAETLPPGTHLHVPFAFGGTPEELLRPARININTATAEELQTLPGIGPVTAKRIEAHRTSEGKFSSVEDIKNVKGIGESLYGNIRTRITI